MLQTNRSGNTNVIIDKWAHFKLTIQKRTIMIFPTNIQNPSEHEAADQITF